MRKSIIAVIASAIMASAMFGGVAQADNPHPNVIIGTLGRDVLVGTSGADVIFGLRGNDWLFGGRGHDILYGGRGNNDQLRAADGMADQLFGGVGRRDGCVGDKHDTFHGCERIVILNVPSNN